MRMESTRVPIYKSHRRQMGVIPMSNLWKSQKRIYLIPLILAVIGVACNPYTGPEGGPTYIWWDDINNQMTVCANPVDNQAIMDKMETDGYRILSLKFEHEVYCSKWEPIGMREGRDAIDNDGAVGPGPVDDDDDDQ